MEQPFSSKLKDTWKQTWNSSLIRAQIIIGTVIISIILGILPSFFNYIEKRNGITLNDPILAAIHPQNATWAIFAIMYGMGILILIRAINTPAIYLKYIWGIIFINIIRIATLSLVPLDPPVGIIVLSDPLTNLFYGGDIITKDLFFSGHTAMLVLITLSLEKKTDKMIGFLSIITVAILLAVQHVHYTLDIIVAPIVAYPMFKLAKSFLSTDLILAYSRPIYALLRKSGS